MKTFLFTSSDGQSHMVRAKNYRDALEILALDRLEEPMIEQYREGEMHDFEVFRRAFESEIELIKREFNTVEIEVLSVSQIKLEQFGKFIDDARSMIKNI